MRNERSMIGFVGLSHLGMVYSHATAAKGFEVVGFDPDTALCDRLNAGQLPIAEPGLADLFAANRSRLRFTSDPTELAQCEVVFFSLDVPTDDANRSNLEPFRKLVELVSASLTPNATAVVLCQVPPGFTRSLRAALAARNVAWHANLHYQVETLIFGNAVERALRPERYMVGCADPQASLPVAYQAWLEAFDCPVLRMRYESAELSKTAINLFLVSSVTTTNTLAEICEGIGADWNEIAPALRLDKRIGPHAYLSPGLGLAGGNLERDLVTVRNLANQTGAEAGIIDAWQLNSRYRRDWVLRKIHQLVLSRNPQPRLAIWGLAYKPNTHSVKNSPSLVLLRDLAPFAKSAYDPKATVDAAGYSRLEIAPTALDACRRADALIIMTPWAEFMKVAPAEIKPLMADSVVIDPYGALSHDLCSASALEHYQLGC